MVLKFDSGDTQALAGVIVVGRSPRQPSHLPPAVLMAYEDHLMTVSKTHFAAGSGKTGYWVEHLHSSNGVEISRDGQRLGLEPGSRRQLESGDVILFGEAQANVEEHQDE